MSDDVNTETTETDEAAPEPMPAEEPSPKDDRTVIDAAADLLQTVVDFLRQEVDRLMKDKVVIPLQRLGFTMFAASGAVSLIVLGLAFVSVGTFMHLGQLIGYANACLLIGAVLSIASAVFLGFRLKLEQKK